MSILQNEVSRASRDVRPTARLGGGVSSISGHLVWPAGADRSEGTPVLLWMGAVRRRLEDLAERPHGWDGYSGRPLSPLAVDAAMPLLATHGRYIQSAPAVALTGDGGLLFRWDSDGRVLELESTSDGELSVYFSDAMGEEHEEYAWMEPELSKWLWQASAVA